MVEVAGPVFTILTPTYNRAHTLPRVFDCLCEQVPIPADRMPFEWLVIDDGSTDTTRQLIADYKTRAPFSIRYDYGENVGKSLALNRGFLLAKGDFCVISDSDDAFKKDALLIFWNSWQGLSETEREDCAGISCCSQDGYTGQRMGREPPGAPCITQPDFLTFCYKNHYFVEGWSAVKTQVFREFPFPKVDGPQKFVPEAYSWIQLGRKYRFLVLADTLRIIFFQPDGYTLNPVQNLRKQARGRFLYHSANINWNRDLMLRFWPGRYFRDLLQAARTAAFAGYTFRSALQGFTRISDCILILPLLFIAYFLGIFKFKLQTKT